MKKAAILAMLFILLCAACSAPGNTPIPTDGPPTAEPMPESAALSSSVVDRSEDGRIILTIGAFQTGNGGEHELLSYTLLTKAVQHFNAKNKDYVAEICNYGDSDSTDALYQLNSEIIGGDMPDMLVTCGMPVGSYAAKGLLLDLYGWYDREQFFGGPLQSMETGGKLFCVSSSIEVVSCYALEDVLGEAEEYSLDDVFAAWEGFYTGENAFIRQFNGTYAFLILAGMRMNEWVDTASCICRFDSPEFLSLLEFCHMLPSEAPVTQSEVYADGKLYSKQIDALCVKNRDSMLGFLYISGETGSVVFQYVDILTPLNGESIVFVGIPGAAQRAAGCISELPIAVSAQGKNHEGVRQFLDSLWDLKYREIHENEMRSIPLMRSVLEDHIQYLRTNSTMTFTDENGAEYEAIYAGPNTMPCTDKDIRGFWSQIEKAYVPVEQTFMSEINPIIAEEALAYFGDMQSAEKTAKNIQARYSLYLEEQK